MLDKVDRGRSQKQCCNYCYDILRPVSYGIGIVLEIGCYLGRDGLSALKVDHRSGATASSKHSN